MDKKLFIYFLLIGILLITIFNTYFVITHYKAFSESPLTFGAREYGLKSCFCQRESTGTLIFDQDKITLQIYGPEQEGLYLEKLEVSKTSNNTR